MSILSKLEGALGNGGRPYRYKISITPAGEASKGELELLNTLAKATTIPGVRIQPRNFMYKGHIIPIDGTKIYDNEWQCTFYLDDDYSTRLILEYWVSYIDAFMSGLSPEPAGKGLMDSLIGAMTSKVKGLVDSFFGASAPVVDSAITKSKSMILVDLPQSFGLNETKDMSSGYEVTRYSPSADVQPSTGAQDLVASARNLINELSNPDDTTNTSKYSLYGTIRISPLGYSGTNDICTYVLHNAFPVSLQAIQFDDSNLQGMSEFTATFAYSHYTIERHSSIGEKIAENGMQMAKDAYNKFF